MRFAIKHFSLKLWSFTLALLLAVSCQYSLAQLDRGTIQVIVSDNTGAVVPNAVVTVTDTATAQKYQHMAPPTASTIFPTFRLASTSWT